MLRAQYIGYLLLVILLFSQACREPFEASSKFSAENRLVVEGFINVGPGITKIKLSRVVALNQGSDLIPETEALVSIEDENNTLYPVENIGNGTYQSEELNLTPEVDYRIRIEIDEKLYLSQYTTPVISPKIDSVSWLRTSNDDILVHVNTHDPASRTRNYKWEYEEVWEVRSNFQSKWAYESGAPRRRSSTETSRMSYCWRYNSNVDFIMASSANLTADVIQLQPLNTFPVTHQRLGWRYSMVVIQRAVTDEEYEFLQIIQKNSTDLGGFFDSQPSQIYGNLYSPNSSEEVIGYIASYSSDKKQLIIKRRAISSFEYYWPCPDEIGSIEFTDPSFDDVMRYWLPVEAILTPVPGEDTYEVTGFTVGRDYCVDCRIIAGNAPKPAFWVAEDQGNVE